MVAAQAVVKKSAAKIVHGMSVHIKELAAAEEWDQIEEALVAMHAAVMNVPEDERRKIIIEVQHCTAMVTDQAKQARQDVTGRIHELRKGQAAKKAYELS